MALMGCIVLTFVLKLAVKTTSVIHKNQKEKAKEEGVELVDSLTYKIVFHSCAALNMLF